MPANWPRTQPDGSPIRVILYARVSTEEQGKTGHQTLDAQIHEMRELANELGWTISREYREKESGTEPTRFKLTYALDQLEAHEADALMVHDLSRLARSLLFTLSTFEKVIQWNALFVSHRERHYDIRDPNDRFFLTLLAAMHEYALELLKSHTRKAKRERVQKGLYNASIIPFGYQHSGKDRPPTRVPHEAAIVLRAFEYHAQGIHSDSQVANWLNAQNYRTRQGKTFTDDLIREMLQNPFYLGKVPYKRRRSKAQELLDGQHEPIVSVELWHQSQQVRQARRGSVRATVPTFRSYLLAERAVCDVCGDRLRSQTQQGGQTYYRENSHEHGRFDCPHRRMSIRTDTADTQMHALLRTLELPKEWQKDLLEKLRNDEEWRTLQKQRRQLKNELSELRRQKQRGEFEQYGQAYFRERDRLQTELAQLPDETELDRWLTASASPAAFSTEWASADPLAQRDLLRLMLSQVRVAMDTGHLVAFTPLQAFDPLFQRLPGLVQRPDGSFVVVTLPKPATVPLLTPLPDVTSATSLVAPPFFTEIPLYFDKRTRIAPALGQALQRCREVKRTLHTLIQITSPHLPPLPADVRRWRGVTARTLDRTHLPQRPDQSVDVVATYLYLWDAWTHPTNEPNTTEWIQSIARILATDGVWYALEVLPTDLPAHWLWRFFDTAPEVIESRIPNLLTLNKALQDAGLTTKVQRRVYTQRVQLDAALTIAKQRCGLLALLPDAVYERGMKHLRQMCAREDATTMLDSRVALVEWWAQKQ